MRYWRCGVIFVDCSCTRKWHKVDLHYCITAVNTDFSPPDIRGLSCTKSWLLFDTIAYELQHLEKRLYVYGMSNITKILSLKQGLLDLKAVKQLHLKNRFQKFVPNLCGNNKNLIGLHCSWWRHQMEIFSALLAICAGNSPVPGEFSTQRPVTRSFDVFLLICVCINGWVNNGEAGDLRCNHAHYDVTVMWLKGDVRPRVSKKVAYPAKEAPEQEIDHLLALTEVPSN